MLILTRKAGQVITIGDDIYVQIIEVKGGQVRLGIAAPQGYAIHRLEVFARIQNEAPVEGKPS